MGDVVVLCVFVRRDRGGVDMEPAMSQWPIDPKVALELQDTLVALTRVQMEKAGLHNWTVVVIVSPDGGSIKLIGAS